MVPERTQARANPARGLALIATAVIVALFLLRNWDGTGDGVAAAGTDGTGTTAVTAPGQTTVPGEAAPTTVAARGPEELSVRVLNATSVPGAAGRMSEVLTNAKYKTIEPDDAGKMFDTTRIVYAAGYEREAVELARAISSPADALEPLADPPQYKAEGANLIVLLGKDLATTG